jgi:hypothetical protein
LNRNLSLGAVALAALALAGCGEKPAMTVNGQAISKDEYIKLLERATIQQPGGQPTKAERLVIDTIVSNQVILAEAGKAGLLPSEENVTRFYDVQKKLMENQQPDKKYDEELAKQGMTQEEVKADLKVQMAETNLYARKLNLGDNDVRAEYDKNRDKIGLPARTQMRLIVLPPNSAEVQQATKMLADGKSFEDVAKTVNNPQLKATGGEQVFSNTQLPPAIQAQCEKLKDGEKVGPIDWVIPTQPGQPAQAPLKAWIKLIKHMPAFNLSYEDAAPILKRDLVRNKILDPANASKRDEVLKVKMQASIQSDDPLHLTVWDDIKKIAKDMGVGAAQTAPQASSAPAPAAAATPAAKPK